MTDGYQKGDRPVVRKLGNPFHILQLVVSQTLRSENCSLLVQKIYSYTPLSARMVSIKLFRIK